jgi:hypothetical protein
MELAPAHIGSSMAALKLELARHNVQSGISARTDAVMILKSTAILFVVGTLTGCCVSGSGCYAPLPGTPTAWDGLGSAPAENTAAPEYQPRKKVRAKKEIIIGPIGDVAAEPNPSPEAKDAWAQQEAADRADEAKLTKQLSICRNCLPAPAHDGATASVPR